MTERHDHKNNGFAGHPPGLVNLFFTEMWERFSFYGMRALLILYMVATVRDGGLGMSMADAGTIYGVYSMSVYLSSMPGGYVADRYLGARLSVLVGGIVIALGHFSMAVPLLPFFYTGMALIVIGTGLLKPNISTMLGLLYKADDPRRDAGFSIFYMGINLGAALSPIVCGFLAQSGEFKGFLKSMGIAEHMSWHWGFAAAGVGMVFGLIQYVLQWKLLGDAGARPQPISASEKQAVDPLSKVEKERLTAIGILFLFSILFWAVYEQGGSSLNVFADRCTQTEIFGWSFPSSWMQALQAIFVIALAPVFSMLWLRLGDRQPSSPAKFTWGLFFLGLGILLMVPASMLAASGKVSPLWLTVVFLIETAGELCLSPVGLSTVTKLAPARYTSLTMGVWFIGMALGNLLAGMLGGMFDENDTARMTVLFGSMAVAAILASGLLAVLVPKVRALMGNIK
ncbi:MAG: peptide MFS transporter [Cyanobacteria bacterium]|nr:peptide MFS transporter [Cyanobacteriota bacterium]